MPDERDIKPFRTKINSSTALSTATTRGSDLQKNTRANKTVMTQQKYANSLKVQLILLGRIGGAENAGVENAGVENTGVDSMGGKCRSGKYRSENVWRAVKAENKLYH